jgi:branched-subunit amino acid transport protein
MIWLVLLAVGLGSFAFRLGPLLLLHRVTLSERGDRVIRDAGLAAITALVATSARQSATTGSVVPVLAAMGVGVGLAARGASMLLLLVVGGATYAGALVVMNVVAR